MSNTDLATIQYLELALISQEKTQLAGRDRFLVLAGVAACQSGWLDVAERCRELVLHHNSHHILSHWTSLVDALRDKEFIPFHQHLQRVCSTERAEMLLSELDRNITPSDEDSLGDFARAQLANPHWNDESR